MINWVNKLFLFLAIFITVTSFNFSVKFQSEKMFPRVNLGNIAYAEPVKVVNVACNTLYSYQRKMVRLSNGWLIAIPQNNSTATGLIYKSTDNGVTWTQIAYAKGGFNDIVSSGTKCTVLFGDPTSSSSKLHSITFDALTVPNTDIGYMKVPIVINQTTFGGGASITIDNLGILHVVFSSTNATYPSNNNMQYSKSIDGGISWSTPVQLTTDSITYNNNYPRILTTSDGKPLVIWKKVNNSSPFKGSLYIKRYNGTSWEAPKLIYSSAYNIGEISAIIDQNNVIHVTWAGFDSVENVVTNIWYAKSTDLGLTWGTAAKLTSGSDFGRLSPSITIDRNNSIYIFFYGIDPAINSSKTQIRYISYNNGIWSSIYTVTHNALQHAQNPQTLAYSDNLVGWMYRDNEANAVMFDKIIVNQEPSLSVLYPELGQVFDENSMSINPNISVSDTDGDNLTCSYYVDSESPPRETKIATNTTLTQTINFSNLDISTFVEGVHTLKFEISDGIASKQLSVNIIIDRSMPVLGTVTTDSTDVAVTVSGTATDSASGLDSYPYRYTVGTNTSDWITNTTFTQNSLIPNTPYLVVFEAKDKAGHTASSTQNVYTKAQVPTLAISNPSTTTLDVSTADSNPVTTNYQIIVNGTSYIDSSGSLTTIPTWITLAGKKITLTGLVANTTYSFQAKTRNEEGIETMLSTLSSENTLSISSWVTRANMLTARYGVSTVELNGKIYAIGGYNGSYLNTVEEYDSVTNTWLTKANMPTARRNLGVAAVNGRIYAIGGNVGAGIVTNVVEEFDPVSNLWSAKANMPTPRSDLGAASVDGKIYAIGGGGDGGEFYTVEEYDPTTNTWATRANMPTKRTGLGVVVINNKLYAVGGVSTGTSYISAVEQYDPVTNTWTAMMDLPTARYSLGVAVVNDKIYAIGGYRWGELDIVEEYDVIMNTWISKTSMPTARYDLGLTAVNGKIYAIGGYNGAILNTVEEYTP